jgi:molecular chaperone DnaK
MTAYHLGIDLGTTYTAAAVHHGAPGRGPEMVTLGERGPIAPSVLFLGPDGRFVAGDAAERHALTQPERVARQFKRRLGDPTPLLVGDQSVSAEALTAELLRWVVGTVERAQGGARAATVVLTHPANWGPYKRDLLTKAAETAGVPGALLVTEPQAAAIAYAAQERIDAGAVVAVYDLGGGTFDAAILRKEADGGFTMMGTPEGIERLGGIDVDAALFAHVAAAAGDPLDDLDPDDPQAVAAVARLRADCTVGKESLSQDSETRVPVLLPTVQTEVRVTRGELESLVRPTLAETVTALERAIRTAGIEAGAVDHVLLVGGSSRMPLVAELVSSGLGRPVGVDAHPKHAIAVGAAIVAARAAGAVQPEDHRPPPPGGPRPAPPTTPAARPPAPAGAGTAAAAPPPPSGGQQPPPAATPSPAPAGPAPSPGPAPPPPPQAPATPGPPPAHGAPAAPAGPPAPPPPPTSAAPAPPPGADPSFPDAAPAGYRGGTVPPLAATSGDLPPGFLTDEGKAARQRKQRRRRALSLVGGAVVLVVAVLATIAIVQNGDESTSLADIEAGECFNGDDFNDIGAVDCAEQHLAQLYEIVSAEDPSGDFPENAGDVANLKCVDAFDDFYGASQDMAAENNLGLRAVAPTEAQWEAGETDSYCLVMDMGGNALLGSLEGQGSSTE